MSEHPKGTLTNSPFHIGIVEDPAVAFRVLERTAQWLEETGKKQRIAATTFQTYLNWQADNANFQVKFAERIVGVFSLPTEPLKDWPEISVDGPVLWLRALATDPEFRRQNVGSEAIQYAIKVAKQRPLFLDCVSGFLPSYYSQQGFKLLRQKEVDGFEINLFKFSREEAA